MKEESLFTRQKKNHVVRVCLCVCVCVKERWGSKGNMILGRRPSMSWSHIQETYVVWCDWSVGCNLF